MNEIPANRQTSSNDRESSVRLASDGSSRRSVSPGDDERTVISTRGPVGQFPETRLLQPLEVGKLLEGEQLGQFILQKFVGGGGMGVVFRAWDTTLNREVAVKVLARDQSADEETLRRFKNEATSAARLDHDNIARVYFVGEDRGVHYIVFEFIEGVNLRDLVDQRGPLSIPEALSYTLQIAEALEHASQRDVIHRDIKPSNVLVTPDGKAKLVDMGLARLHHVDHAENDLTASGVTLGTFDYISPEQARDPRSADVRSDLYSLGCSFYYMLTGRPPFPEGTVLQKLLQHQGDEPPDPREYRADLGAGVIYVLGKLLAKNPERRFQTPGDLAEELRGLRKEHGSATIKMPAVQWMAQPSRAGSWRRHLPWLAPVAGLAIIAAALDHHWSRADVDSKPPTRNRPAVQAASSAKNPPRQASVDSHVPGAEPNKSKPLPRQPGPVPKALAGFLVEVPGMHEGKPHWTNGLRFNPLNAEFGEEPFSASLDLPPEDSAAASIDAAGDDASGPRPSTGPASARSGVLIVGDLNGESGHYATLRAACAAATSGQVIELQFDGPRPEQPFHLSGARVTIRAGEGYSPIISFRPAAADRSPTAMLRLTDSQLALINVQIEFPAAALEHEDSALFECSGQTNVRLEKSSLAVAVSEGSSDAKPSEASFFKAGHYARPAASTFAGGTDIELKDCLVRGNANLLSTNNTAGVRLAWHNGLLLTGQRLLVAGSSPGGSSTAQVDLKHLTSVTSAGLVLLESPDQGHAPPIVDFRCADSVLAGPTGACFVEERGRDALAAESSSFQWSADRNCYEGWGDFWKRQNLLDPGRDKLLDYAGWRTYWSDDRENLPSRNAVGWPASLLSGVAWLEMAPADYNVRARTPGSPAVGGASDGRDLGCIAELLPVAAMQPKSGDGNIAGPKD